jgi:hypothetical protein
MSGEDLQGLDIPCVGGPLLRISNVSTAPGRNPGGSLGRKTGIPASGAGAHTGPAEKFKDQWRQLCFVNSVIEMRPDAILKTLSYAPGVSG